MSYYNRIKKTIIKLAGDRNIDENVLVTAEILKIPTAEAKEKMDEIKKLHGLSYADYVDNKLFKYKTKKKLNARVEKIKAYRVKQMEQYAVENQTAYQELQEKAEKIKKKFGISHRIYMINGFVLMSESEIREKVNVLFAEKEKNCRQVMAESGWNRKRVEVHMKRFEAQYDFSAEEYILYRAWELTDEEADSFISAKMGRKLQNKFNRKSAAVILHEDNKSTKKNPHHKLEEFHSDGECKVRVVTVIDREENVHIVCTDILFGGTYGMICGVDAETGIILTPAVKRSRNTGEIHPVSGKQYKGFQIPIWKQILEAAEAAAREQDGIGYASWNISVYEDCAVVTDGSSAPDLTLIQLPYVNERIGKKQLFTPYLEQSFAAPDKKSKRKKKVNRYNINTRVVAEILGISNEAAKREIDEICEKYDITQNEYVEHKMFRYDNDESRANIVESFKSRDKKYIMNICDDTGWSYDEALEHAREAAKKFKISILKYSKYRFFALSEEEIQAKLDEWSNRANEYRKIVMEESGWSEDNVRLHMKRFNVQFDIPAPYYVLYRGWELTDEQIDSYARQGLSKEIWFHYNIREEADVLAEKDRFDQVYKDYIKRKFWINVDTDFEQFLDFIEGLDYVFCKPIMFGGGLGAEKHKVDHENPKELYNLLMSKPRLLVEECVKQHPEIDEFVPGCVNTIRVVTIQEKSGERKIISTGIRFGYNSITDNFSHDGMVCDVDPKTGIIRTPAIDKKGYTYTVHPISGKKFEGFRIPLWDEAVKVALDAIGVQEGVNYVGWDLAVCENKVVIIEGNSMPDLVLVQAPYARAKIGKRYLFEPYLKGEQ